jgi:hypothetical protein
MLKKCASAGTVGYSVTLPVGVTVTLYVLALPADAELGDEVPVLVKYA